jgi:hypothetical protein
MKCTFHLAEDASAICPGCSRALCGPCAQKFTVVLCPPCLQVQNRAIASGHWTKLISTALLFGGAIFFLRSLGGPKPPPLQLLAMTAALPCLYWGWHWMSEGTSRSILLLSPGLWLIRGVFKLVFAAILGVVAAPVGIIRSVLELIKIRRTTAWLNRSLL